MNNQQLLRYSRHLLLNEISIENQEKLLNASILVIGCGGLANAALPYLAASGVGNIIIADNDHIDQSNLQRQIAYTEQDIGKNKAQTMATFLQARQSDCTITILATRLEQAQLHQLAPQCHLILDCSDNYTTRHAINQAAVSAKKPLISAAASQFNGQLAIYRPDLANQPCYACLFDPNESTTQQCATFGIFSPIVGIIGSMQAAEALKILMGLPSQSGILHCYQGLTSQWQTYHFQQNPQCPVCHSFSKP